MHMIGITGGAGAGKSEILRHLRENPRFLVREADRIAEDLIKNGEPLYHKVIEVLGEDIVDSDGNINRPEMAKRIFGNEELKEKINSLIHPAVNDFVQKDRKEAEISGKYDIYFLEAALLIECGYGEICDELWYIYADEDVRRRRLKKTRGYSDEKIDGILKSQLKDSDFRKNCTQVIDNSGDIKNSLEAIDRLISGYTC